MEDDKSAVPLEISFRESFHHFTWAWFTLTMSTGGISLPSVSHPPSVSKSDNDWHHDIHSRPCPFHHLNNPDHSPLHPGTFMRSWNHPTESLFIPTFWLTIATTVSNMFVRPLASCNSSRPLLDVFSLHLRFYHPLISPPIHRQTAHYLNKTLAWLLPIFLLMLCGTLASVTAGTQTSHHGILIIAAGATLQGVGFLVAVFMYSNYVSRLMLYGLPFPKTRPGMPPWIYRRKANE